MLAKVKFAWLFIVLVSIVLVSVSASSGLKSSLGDPYGKGRFNLVEKFYQELVDKSQELKNLESEIKELSNREALLIQNFNDYHADSKEYYADAIQFSNSISDTFLKNKMLKLVTKSTENYNLSIDPILKNITKSKQNDIGIADYHSVLKIVKTISVIEKYQKDNLPSNSAFENHIKNQNNIIEKIKGQTPAY